MAVPMKRVVPWIDRTEWKNVYQEIFSDDAQDLKHALDRIAVWKCRVGQRLSAAVQSTWELCSAMIHDRDVSCSRNGRGDESCTVSPSFNQCNSQMDLQMLYGTAIIRFVNLMTEKGQNKLLAQPIQVLAAEVGIPEWLVDLRHEATHSALPSLERLRPATQFALNWLKTSYWDAELEENESEGDYLSSSPGSFIRMSDEDLQRSVSEILIDTSQCQFKSRDPETTESSFDGNRAYIKSLLKNLEIYSKRNSKLVVSVLIDDGYLLATAEQLKTLDIKIAGLLKSCSLELPASLVSMWMPVIKVLRRLDVTNELLEGLVTRLCDNEEGEREGGERAFLVNRLAAGWIHTILSKPAGFTNSVKVSKTELNVRRLLKLTLHKPNKWTTLLLKRMFEHCSPALSMKAQERLLRLVEHYLSPTSEPLPHTGSDAVYTGVMLSGNNGCSSTTVQATTDHTRRWNLSNDDIEWSSCPLGHGPAQPPTYTSLELFRPVESRCQRESNAGHTRNDDSLEMSTTPDGDSCSDMEQDEQDVVESVCDIRTFSVNEDGVVSERKDVKRQHIYRINEIWIL